MATRLCGFALIAALVLAACNEPKPKPMRPPLETVGKDGNQDPIPKPNPDNPNPDVPVPPDPLQPPPVDPNPPVPPPVNPPVTDKCSDPGASKIDPPPTDAERAYCRQQSGGSACDTNCWNRAFYDRVKAAVANPSTPPAPATVLCTVTGDGIRLREVPNGTIIDEMANGANVTKLEESTETCNSGANKWFKVKYQTKVGYTCSAYLNCN